MSYSVVAKHRIPGLIAGAPDTAVWLYQVTADGATGTVDASGEFHALTAGIILGCLGSTPATVSVSGTTATFASGTAGLIGLVLFGT